jgi:selenocysteine lyase/cysteine desulfurase
MATDFDVSNVRNHFPALNSKQIYFDNAGGSQVLKEVIDSCVCHSASSPVPNLILYSISTYLSTSNVQLGASYPIGQASTRLVDEGCKAVAKYINASPEEVVLGPSTTQLFRNVSISLYEYITEDSEIIVSKIDHEANIASWVSLAKDRGAKLRKKRTPRSTATSYESS